MATSVDLPDNLARLLEQQVENGNYRSKSEVIRDALRRLFEQKGLIESRDLSREAITAIRTAREEESLSWDEAMEQLTGE